MNTNQPLFFAPNRVWRLYTGGVLLDRFLGTINESDNHLPEEWLASTVLANNGEHTLRSDEGLARIFIDNKVGPSLQELLINHGEEILGKQHYSKYGQTTAVLCKYLDSAIRLPIQCHPDVNMSKRLFNSSFGKTECWHIISTRTIDNEKPYILLGFKPGIKQEDFAKAVYDQDIPAMIEMLHRILVKPAAMEELDFSTDEILELLVCLPPSSSQRHT